MKDLFLYSLVYENYPDLRKFTEFEIGPSTVLGELQIECVCKTAQITVEAESLQEGLVFGRHSENPPQN